MANKSTKMLQIRRLLQLLLSGFSERQISVQTGMSRNTIATYVKRFKASGKDYKELLLLDDQQLGSLVHNHFVTSRKDERYDRLAANLSHYISQLTKTGVTRYILWEEYRQLDKDGYSYQQFCEHLNTYASIRNAVMWQQHKPGEVVQFDFAGEKLSYIDKLSGEVIYCPVFIAILPYSSYTYVEALPNATLEQLIATLAAFLLPCLPIT